MTLPSLTDAELLAALDAGERSPAIAARAGVTVRTIERRVLRLAAMRAGSAVRASQEIVRQGLDHAAGYLLVGSVTLDRIVAMAEEAETLDENRRLLIDAILRIAEDHDGDELYTRETHKLLLRASEPRDPDALLFRAIDVYQKNIVLFTEVYEKMANVRFLAQVKEMLLTLLDIENPVVRAAIEKIVNSEAARGLLGVDRYHPEPEPGGWSGGDEQAFLALPHPSTLPTILDHHRQEAV
jgi:hypothetical protein